MYTGQFDGEGRLENVCLSSTTISFSIYLFLYFQTQPDETRTVFNAQLEKYFVTFKNGNFFIAMKRVGTIKKIKGRNHKRNSRFVLLTLRQENEDSARKDSARKRRFPAGLGLGQTRLNNLRLKLFSDLQRR